MVNNYLVGGICKPLWRIYKFVSWDDDIPNIWKVKKIMFQTTNQTLIEDLELPLAVSCPCVHVELDRLQDPIHSNGNS